MKAALQDKAKASSNARLTFTPVRSGLLQRKCACGGTPGPSGECESCRKKKLQRRSENLDPSSIINPLSSVSEVPPILHEVRRSPDRLDDKTRALAEPRFGHRFGRVSVQSSEPCIQPKSRVSTAADRYEPEVDRLADPLEQMGSTLTSQASLQLSRGNGRANAKDKDQTYRNRLAKGDTDNALVTLPGLVEGQQNMSEPPQREQETLATEGVLQNMRAFEPSTESQTTITTAVEEDGVPSIKLKKRDWGLIYPEKVDETVTASKSGGKWRTEVTSLQGHYSKQTRLLAGVTEVTGPGGNTNSKNFCAQLRDLAERGYGHRPAWFILDAVVAHENLHATRMLPALQAAAPSIQAAFNRATAPDAQDKTAATALLEIQGGRRYAKAKSQMQEQWLDEADSLVKHDHDPDGPADTAEDTVLFPMMATICDHARKESWGPCDDICLP